MQTCGLAAYAGLESAEIVGKKIRLLRGYPKKQGDEILDLVNHNLGFSKSDFRFTKIACRKESILNFKFWRFSKSELGI